VYPLQGQIKPSGLEPQPLQAKSQKEEKTMTTTIADVEVLQPEVSVSQSQSASLHGPVLDGSRCVFRFSNGKRCRRSGLESQSGLCSYHFDQRVVALPPVPSDFTDLSEVLLRGPLKFSSAEDLREYLTRLLILMTEGRVSPRRASVLAYITTQLLHTHVAAEKEADQPQPFNFDLPRPKRD